MTPQQTQNWFLTTYSNIFRTSRLFQYMEEIFEDSPWHREKNILIHTDMVIDFYTSKNDDLLQQHPKYWVVGALACAFHDVGKPSSLNMIYPEEGKEYKSFSGHELKSARLWEDYVTSNWELFDGIIDAHDIYKVSWLIEHHLPYKLKKQNKLFNLHTTDTVLCGSLLPRVVRADSYGRMSDDHDNKKKDVENWILDYTTNETQKEFIKNSNLHTNENRPNLFVLIGASGTGKSSFSQKINTTNHFSLDKIRHERYGDDYTVAFASSCTDKEFTPNIQKQFIRTLQTSSDIISDNVNLSVKRRHWFINEARRKNYNVVAVTFPISLEVLLFRASIRSDKCVPHHVVIQQYYALQQPSLGEFDEIIVEKSNIS